MADDEVKIKIAVDDSEINKVRKDLGGSQGGGTSVLPKGTKGAGVGKSAMAGFGGGFVGNATKGLKIK